ncbi:hypothetical protein [Kingella oralis]
MHATLYLSNTACLRQHPTLGFQAAFGVALGWRYVVGEPPTLHRLWASPSFQAA